MKKHWLIILVALVAGLVGGAVSGWIFFMVDSSGTVGTDIEIAKLFIQIGSAVLVAIGIVVSAFLVRKQMTTIQDWNRRKATRDMAESFSGKFYERSGRLRETLKVDFSTPNQTCKTFLDKDDKKVMEKICDDLLPILSGLEQMAWGIKYDMYDDNLAYTLYSPILRNVYRWAKSYIKFVRDQPGLNSKAYIELEQLYEIWQAPSREERNEKLLAYRSKSLEDL